MLISSDTNIWFDFNTMGRISDPFRLPHEYYLSDLTLAEEIYLSDQLQADIRKHGLKITSASSQELTLAISYEEQFPALSTEDRVALAIAKERGWILLSGDQALVNAAQKISVEVHGTIWVYDQLKELGIMNAEEYLQAMKDLLKAIDFGGRRLPRLLIMERIKQTIDEIEKK